MEKIINKKDEEDEVEEEEEDPTRPRTRARTNTPSLWIGYVLVESKQVILQMSILLAPATFARP